MRRYNTARAGLQKLQIPLGPLSIGQASAIELVLGAPPPPGAWEEGGDRPANKTGDSWNQSVSLSTCYPVRPVINCITRRSTHLPQPSISLGIGCHRLMFSTQFLPGP